MSPVPRGAASADRLELISGSPERTAALGAALARALPDGAVVHLVGEIGTGKTTLVRGAARALGIEGPVTSPTFTIANRYVGQRALAHVDAWRLGGGDAEDLATVASSVGDDALVFVEWPGGVTGAVSPPTVRVELEHRSPSERLVRLEAPDSAIRSAIARLFADTGARHGGSEPEPRDPGGR